MKKRAERMAFMAVSMLMVFLMCFSLSGCKDKNEITPESVANSAMQALWVDRDSGAAIALLHDEYHSAAATEQSLSKEEYKKYIQSEIDKACDDLEQNYPNWSVSWDITNVQIASDAELQDTNSYNKNAYNINCKIEEIRKITIKVTINYISENQMHSEESEENYSVFLIDNKWYLDPESADMI